MACYSVVPYKLGLANETLTVAAVAPTKSTWKSDALACLAPKRTCCHQTHAGTSLHARHDSFKDPVSFHHPVNVHSHRVLST